MGLSVVEFYMRRPLPSIQLVFELGKFEIGCCRAEYWVGIPHMSFQQYKHMA
jgi:hypothetical protein